MRFPYQPTGEPGAVAEVPARRPRFLLRVDGDKLDQRAARPNLRLLR
jgi:hypothetical protein